jgi:hypothetical protein
VRRRRAKLRPKPSSRSLSSQPTKKAEGRRPYYPSDFKAREPKERLLTAAKKRAAKLGVPFRLTADDVAIPELCPALGFALYAIDRPGGGSNTPVLVAADPERGFVPGNVAVVSAVAARLLSEATPDQMLRVADWMEAAQAGEPLPLAQPTPA